MSECNAIIEANNEIDRLKRENKKLNGLCVQYGFDMGRLDGKNEQLKETIKELELENAKHIGDGEWDIRDITYRHGKFRLEEWGERYHQFYNGDKQLEDEEVVSLLFENEQLKEENKELKQDNDIKFWKLQYLRQHNSTQLIVHEILSAIKQGYEMSDEFKKYIDDLKENNKKIMEKNKRLFGDSND